MKTAALAAIILALTAPACAHGRAAEPARLILNVETGAPTGMVMVSLFDSEAAYSGGKPIRQARIDVAAGERSAVIAGLPAGTYAMKAFHDVNGDGRMNTNPFGLPIEPFAFSNNAAANMGPAPWSKSGFTVSGETTQTLVLR